MNSRDALRDEIRALARREAVQKVTAGAVVAVRDLVSAGIPRPEAVAEVTRIVNSEPIPRAPDVVDGA
ncbi:MAG: hypothetical protein ACHQPI_02935 [Thermoanaerobaculia bacterium]